MQAEEKQQLQHKQGGGGREQASRKPSRWYQCDRTA